MSNEKSTNKDQVEDKTEKGQKTKEPEPVKYASIQDCLAMERKQEELARKEAKSK